MNESTGWVAVGLAAVSNMAVWLKIIFDNRKNGNGKDNLEDKPGTAQICINRGEDMAVMKNQIKGFNKSFEEIKDSLKNIEDKI